MGEERGSLDMLSSSSSDVSSVVSSDGSDVFEEVNSSGCSSPRSPDSSAGKVLANGPLQDMSSLLEQLPFKRGLSKHYNGKSQSFTSLANVKCLEDLAKPENPYNKKLKSCKSYALFESHHHTSSQPHRSANTSSRLISDKAARGSCSSLSVVQRNSGGFLGNTPPIPPPHRSTSSTSFATQTPLFA